MSKFTVQLKDPDGFWYLMQELTEEQQELLSKWVTYGECIEIEFDFKKMKAKVLTND